MKLYAWIGIGLLGLGASTGVPAWGAESDQLDSAAASLDNAGSTRVAGKVADKLTGQCNGCGVTFSEQSVKDQRTQTGLGWGSVFIANSLALKISQQQSIPFSQAFGQVTAARQQGMGWGAIGHANGLKVGDTTKSANALAASAKAESQASFSGTGRGSGRGSGVAAGVGGGVGHGSGGGQGGGHGNGQGGGQGSGHGGGGNGGGGGGGGGKK
jgi:hypothetical protein